VSAKPDADVVEMAVPIVDAAEFEAGQVEREGFERVALV
jgi:hypothetical protein